MNPYNPQNGRTSNSMIEAELLKKFHIYYKTSQRKHQHQKDFYYS